MTRAVFIPSHHVPYKPIRVFSHGMGTQSVAVTVAQGEGLLPNPYDVFVFANVGTQSENPATLAYMRDVLRPYMASKGMTLVEVWRKDRAGNQVDLFEYTMSDANRSIPMPVYFSEGGVGNRKCTLDWKVRVVSKWIREHHPSADVEMGIGYSADETHRAAKKPLAWHDTEVTWDNKRKCWVTGRKLGYWQRYDYPLIEMQLRRERAIEIIKSAGLPVPPPSHCEGCPFMQMSEFLDMRRNQPDRFRRLVEIEDRINTKYQRIRAGSPHRSKRVTLYRGYIPLSQLPAQMSLWDRYIDADASCDEAGSVCGV